MSDNTRKILAYIPWMIVAVMIILALSVTGPWDVMKKVETLTKSQAEIVEFLKTEGFQPTVEIQDE